MFAALNSFLTRSVSGYFLNKSLRFRESASAYLNRTVSTTGNRQTFTFSFWCKLGALDTTRFLYGASIDPNNEFSIRFFTDNTLGVYNYASAYNLQIVTTQVFRDPSAWYHIVVAIDTTQATSTDRVKVYVNGSQITAFSLNTYPAQNYNTIVNYSSTPDNRIASLATNTPNYYDGELAEFNFVDGYPTGVTSGTWAATNVSTIFGASSTYNQWLPKAYAGTYGTNGFYLPFSGGTTTSYAGSFNGSSQYISVTPNTSLQFGSGDFTIECWVYKSANGSTYDGICQLGTNSSGNDGFYLIASNTATGYEFGSQGVAICSYNGSIRDSQWHHIAVSRTGTTTRMFIDGVQRSSYGSTYTIPSTATVFTSGVFSSSYYYLGYISNLRLIKGTGLYTANFIPPTAPLTAVSGTSLLTLQNATIVDNSTNAFTITNTGTVVTSVQSPFLNTTVLTTDSSGNANNWTPNNISLTAGSTYDSLTDVPTLTSETVANYAVLNPLFLSTFGGSNPATPSNANLTIQDTTIAGKSSVGTISVNSGKWYFEVQSYPGGTANNNVGIGVTNIPDPYPSNVYYFAHYSASYASGSIIGVVLDFTALTIKFYVANVLVQTTSIAANSYVPLFNVSSNNGSTATMHANFGQQPFTYTAPSGFLPLNTFNI